MSVLAETRQYRLIVISWRPDAGVFIGVYMGLVVKEYLSVTSQIFEFLKLWDLLRCSGKVMKNAYWSKILIVLQIGGEKLALLCSNDSIQRDVTTLGLFGVRLVIQRSLSQFASAVPSGGRGGGGRSDPSKFLLGCVTLFSKPAFVVSQLFKERISHYPADKL